jgi:hypothetical protein
MLSPGRPQQATEESVPDARPRCAALVPVTPSVPRRRVPQRQLSRADFVTHLIATAEHAPQTRHLRRATPADAQIAYKAHQCELPGAGIRMQQVI